MVGDLEVFLGDLHARVELQGAEELLDRLGDEALLIVENAEVVVRPRIGGIDAAGERAEDREIAFGEGGPGHGEPQVSRMASKMARRLARSGSSRKCPRSLRSGSSNRNWVSTQNT